jgi:hypothetical protein
LRKKNHIPALITEGSSEGFEIAGTSGSGYLDSFSNSKETGFDGSLFFKIFIKLRIGGYYLFLFFSQPCLNVKLQVLLILFITIVMNL